MDLNENNNSGDGPVLNLPGHEFAIHVIGYNYQAPVSSSLKLSPKLSQ